MHGTVFPGDPISGPAAINALLEIAGLPLVGMTSPSLVGMTLLSWFGTAAPVAGTDGCEDGWRCHMPCAISKARRDQTRTRASVSQRTEPYKEMMIRQRASMFNTGDARCTNVPSQATVIPISA